ncbi:Protein CBG03918 [Caenorhabditis briggsae]|uniref:Protein CBG03918 n=1 Tax=Caenorhabditis briggsae TaxID=6238 RepID=A8WVR3_CAEBR|nr:Protein CBG03918 [Caenorhabditis briggsae]CAP24726.2 Protein CBG03918 [Caenorhabditis briggsae]
MAGRQKSEARSRNFENSGRSIASVLSKGCQKISIFLYVDWALRKNANENEEGKSSGTVGKFENEYQRKKLISDGSVKFADFEKNVQSITCVRVTSKQQSTSSSAHRHRLRQKWTKREAPMPFQPVRQQRKRII